MHVEPTIGINMDLGIHAFRLDTFQLDTIFLDIHQETTALKLKTGVINGPKNPMPFSAFINGEVSDKEAGLTLKFLDAKGREGLYIGANMQQELNDNGKPKGYLFHIIPEASILAFHPFHFVDHLNWVYLHNNGRLYPSVMMQDNEGMGSRVQSYPTDTVSHQTNDSELHMP